MNDELDRGPSVEPRRPLPLMVHSMPLRGGDFCAFFNRPGVDGGVAPREYELSCLGAACPGRCPDGVPNRGASAGEGASRSDMLKEEIVARLRSSPA